MMRCVSMQCLGGSIETLTSQMNEGFFSGKKQMAKTKKHQAKPSHRFRHGKFPFKCLDSVNPKVIGACARSQEWRSALDFFTEHLGVMPFALPRNQGFPGFNGSFHIWVLNPKIGVENPPPQIIHLFIGMVFQPL